MLQESKSNVQKSSGLQTITSDSDQDNSIPNQSSIDLQCNIGHSSVVTLHDKGKNEYLSSKGTNDTENTEKSITNVTYQESLIPIKKQWSTTR